MPSTDQEAVATGEDRAEGETIESQELESLLAELEDFQTFAETGLQIFQADNALFPVDFMAMGILKRAMSLNHAFCLLIRNNNFLAACSLVRLQLDNVLRFYGVSRCANPHDVATDVFSGKALKDIKDRSNQKLNDGYLVKCLAVEIQEIDIHGLYNQACSYIHFSDRHIKHAIVASETGTREVRMAAGPYDNPEVITDIDRIETAVTMLHVTHLVRGVLETWRDVKRRAANA